MQSTAAEERAVGRASSGCAGGLGGGGGTESVWSAAPAEAQRRRSHRGRGRASAKCLVSQEAVRCLHHTVAGVCVALPQVYPPRDFRRGFGADCERCPHEKVRPRPELRLCVACGGHV